jgi:spore coat protein U-like protein
MMRTFIQKIAVPAGLLFVMLVSSEKASAQSTVLNVKINPVIALSVNQASTDLEFNTHQDYVNGVSKVQTGHLTVTSTTPYHINVKAGGATLNGTEGSIPVSSIKIEPEAGQAGIGTLAQTALSASGNNIITAAQPAIAKNINIKYSTVGGDTNFINLKQGTYSVQVTYTAVAN